MSSTPGREVAHRLFAAEYDDADFEYSESDEERAPNYVVTPTGARVNRAFVVGVLTEVETVGEEVLRARVVDPTGAFVVYAGQYQPEALAFLESADPPAFVAVTGKARTFSPDDTDVVYTSLRPESINEVDAETRDRWTVEAAEHTLARLATFDAALESGLAGDDLRAGLEAAGAPEATAAGVPLALDHYGTTEHYLATMADVALDALRLVAGEVEEVSVPDVAPDVVGDRAFDRERVAAATDLDVVDPDAIEAPAVEETEGSATGPEESTDGTADPESADPADATDETEATAASGTDDADDGGDSDGEDDAGDVEDSDGEDDAGDVEDSDGEDDADDDLGDFDGGDVDASAMDESRESAGDEADETTTTDAGADAEEPPEDVLDDDERERIESEYGTDFRSGTEVDEPGEADIEPEAGPIEPDEAGGDEPEGDESATGDGETDAETAAEPGDDAGTEPGDDAGPEPGDESEPDAAGEASGDSGAVDVQDAVLSTMRDLDDGTGADREVLVSSVVEEHGVAADDVEAAIEDALMSGQCYEPDDGKLSAI